MNLFLCIILLFLDSCITKAVWRNKSYEEKIEHFFVGSDGRYLVLVGQKYHYVFTDNAGLFKAILSLKQKGVLTLEQNKTYLKLDSNNNIAGSFVIEGPFSVLPREDMYLLTSLGFKPDKHDNLSIEIELVGRRYSSKYLGQALSKSNSTYKLLIYYDDSSLTEGLGKVAITPVTVTLDAVLLIGKIIIYPFSL
jgi:hypothetical protein